MSKPQGLFWIKGNPGSGKSVLMKYAFTVMSQQLGELVLSFFVQGRGTQLQKSPLGMFRALLNSMLTYFPQYLSQLTKRFEDREKRFGSYQEKRWEWNEKELQEFLSHVLVKATRKRSVVIFVDALDECGKDIAKSLLSYFKDLMEDIKNQGSQVKICFSSRHYPIIGHDTIPAVSVEERNDNDIRLVIQQRLKEVEPQIERQRIEKDILLKAHGGFQWTVLVTNMVIEGNATGIKVEKLRETLASTPEDLDELYTDILRDASDIEKDQMINLFEWILFSGRPLSAQELREALATDSDTIYTTISELRNHDVWIDNLAQFEKRVKQISRGLVEFHTREVWEQYELGGEDSDREVQFVHQSVADYMLNKFLKNAQHRYGSSQSQTGIGHYHISTSCIRYLTIKELLQQYELPRGKLSARFPLAPYAIQFLIYHIWEVEQEGIPQPDLLSLIQWEPQSDMLRKFASIWKLLDPDSAHAPAGWPFVEATALHVLIAFGSKSAFNETLQGEDVEVNGKDAEGNTPLLRALLECRQDMALALLNWSIKQQYSQISFPWNTAPDKNTRLNLGQVVDVSIENDYGETPLGVALDQGAGEVIISLIEAGANPKFPSEEAALVHYAIRQRNEELLMSYIEKNFSLDGAVYFALKELSIKEEKVLESFVSRLLKAGGNTSKYVGLDAHPGEDSTNDQEDPEEDEAFYLALRRGRVSLVKLLLSCGASPICWDRYGKSPLFQAVKNGQGEIAKILAQEVPSIVTMEDFNGDTPLCVAAKTGKDRLVKILLDTGKADVDARDRNGQTALSWATWNKDEAVVKLLLHIGKADVNMKYRDGQTVLLLAAKKRDEAVVKLLLSTGNADVNLKDNYGETALLLAARNRNKAVVELLLSTNKADVNVRDRYGDTALLLSAKNRDESVVKLLLSKGKTDVNVRDRYGQTALLWATGNKDEAVVKLLLGTGKANINLADQYGQTPLWSAACGGLEAVVKLLLDTGKANINLEDRYGQTPLWSAACGGHEAVVRLLLNTEEANIDSKNQYDQTPLSLAACGGYEAIVKLLLDTGGANVNSKNRYDQTPLSLAACSGHEAVVKLLFDTGKVDINLKDQYGQTPLLSAACGGHEAVVRLLLNTGKADVDLKNMHDQTPLWLAARGGHEAVVKLLLDTGNANVNFENQDRETPLWLAACGGHGVVVKLPLNTGKVNVNVRDRNGRTPLSGAANNEHKDIVKLLLEAEADVNSQDKYGWAPLSLAAQTGCGTVVKMLLEAGADVSLKEHYFGRTPLYWATTKGHKDVIRLLKSFGAK